MSGSVLYVSLLFVSSMSKLEFVILISCVCEVLHLGPTTPPVRDSMTQPYRDSVEQTSTEPTHLGLPLTWRPCLTLLP